MSNTMRTRVWIGPWVGEFGWELMMWQGHARTYAKNFKEVYVSSRPEMEYLYRDFATKFIPHDIRGETDCDGCNGKRYTNYLNNKIDARTDILFPPRKYPVEWVHKTLGREIFKKQTFIKYGKKTGKYNFDILIHARCTNKKKSSNRNYKSWNELIHKLSKYKVACIGSKDASKHIQGTIDMRGVSLEKLCNMMADSKLVIGPSSGPMHLASLCGTTHIVFTYEKNKIRYEKCWNPFDTKAIVLVDENWQPKVSTVMKAIKENI